MEDTDAMGFLLTLILVQDFAKTVAQTNRDLDSRLIAIQQSLVKMEIERERAVEKISGRIDKVDDAVGPKLDKVAAGLDANSAGLTTLNKNMEELLRVAKEVEPIAEDVRFLLRLLIWIVGPGGAAWAGRQFLVAGREGNRLLKRQEKP